LVSHIHGKHRLRVFENTVLRELLRSTGKEGTEDWRRLYKEELHYLYSSMITSRGKQEMEHVTCIGERGGHTGLWWGGDIRDGDHLEDLGVNVRIILKLILNIKLGE
jgi:hypothetical protein